MCELMSMMVKMFGVKLKSKMQAAELGATHVPAVQVVLKQGIWRQCRIGWCRTWEHGVCRNV
jgi:hypothetical protein